MGLKVRKATLVASRYSDSNLTQTLLNNLLKAYFMTQYSLFMRVRKDIEILEDSTYLGNVFKNSGGV